MTSGHAKVLRAVPFWAPTALLCALALPMQSGNGLLIALGALAAALTAIGLCAVVACGRAYGPRGTAATTGVHGVLRGHPARQHDPDAAGRVRPRAPGRVRRHG